jgi:glucose/arabinose dehydrogenase
MHRSIWIGLASALLVACGGSGMAQVQTGPNPPLPAPEVQKIPVVNTAKAVGWKQGARPVAAAGLAVAAFAEGLDHPRWLYVLANGDVLVAETNAPPKPGERGFKAWVTGKVMANAGAGVASANRITLLRDTDGDGHADVRSVLLDGLHSPFGMALVGTRLYVANADAVVWVPYKPGDTTVDARPVQLAALPGGPRNHHWTKSLLASADGRRLYVGVGSNSNVGENGMDAEVDRAAVLEIDVATGQKRPFATGLRNPVGLAWEPRSKALWLVANERDEIGNDLVPDYLTSVRRGAFYGWPYSYWGRHVDPRPEPPRPDLVARAIAPDYALGAHVAALGLAFAPAQPKAAWPAPFGQGAFVGEHGSWNRKPRSGYKVVFVPFRDGKPSGAPVDVLTGFLDKDEQAQGRPVGVAFDARGGLLVADDVGNTIWRVAPGAAATPR